jgi:hypothetical protein
MMQKRKKGQGTWAAKQVSVQKPEGKGNLFFIFL